MKGNVKKIIACSVSAVILVVVLAANIACGIFSELITTYLCGTKSLDSETAAAGAELAVKIEEEGIVMVKNAEDTLPLDRQKSAKVNVFGWASTDWVYGGSGSGGVNAGDDAIDLLGALSDYGISYNTELTEMYKTFQDGRAINTGSLYTHDYEYSRLYEPSISDKNYYTNSILNNAEGYSDVAIVVLGRITGESNDCPKVQYKNYTPAGIVPESNIDASRTYLDISTEEEELLRYVGELLIK